MDLTQAFQRFKALLQVRPTSRSSSSAFFDIVFPERVIVKNTIVIDYDFSFFLPGSHKPHQGKTKWNKDDTTKTNYCND